MPRRKPLVLDSAAQTQQLQGGDELDIPLADRVDELERKFSLLTQFLLGQGIELPEELLN